MLNNLKPFAWGLVIGAFGWWIALAYGFGWTSAGTARQEAARHTQQAVVAALAPVCANRFLALPNAAAKKAGLAEAASWKRDEFFPEQWVTLPGESSADPDLVTACSRLVLEKSVPPPTKEKAASLPASKG